jgi:ribonuclease Z
MSKFDFTLIGSGAVRVNLNRGGPAQVLSVEGSPLLFDCGRCAVHNLHRFGFPAESIQEVFLTHLHFDHVCDLAYLILLSWNNGRNSPLPIYGPPGTADFVEHNVRLAYKQDIQSRVGHGKSTAGLEWTVHEIHESGPVWVREELEISALYTEHADMPNLNYRIRDHSHQVVITSDTRPSPELTRFCCGSDLLVIECSGTPEFLDSVPWGGWHMNPDTVAELARDAQVGTVIIKHLVIEDWEPDPDIAAHMVKTIQQTFNGNVLLGKDGLNATV